MDERKGNEKRVSLHPLKFEDALRGLLQTTPKGKKTDEERKVPNGESS